MFNWLTHKKKETKYDSNEFHNLLIEQINFESNRRKNLSIIKNHPTQSIHLKEGCVEIDRDMIPIIDWFNSLKDTSTQFCCQGDVYDPTNNPIHDRPYLVWKSHDPKIVSQIIKLFNDFYQESKGKNCYHYIETEVNWYENELRYTSRWFDNLALHDFIEWAGNSGLLMPHFRVNYAYILKSWHYTQPLSRI